MKIKWIKMLKGGYGNLKIKYKFWILMLVLIIPPILAFGIYSYRTDLNYTYDEESYDFMNTVSQVSTNLDNILYNLQSNAESIYGDVIIQKVLEGEPVLSINGIDQANEIINQKISVNTNAATFLFGTSGQIYGYNMYFYPDYSTDFRQTDEYRKCKAHDFKLIWIPTNHISIRASLDKMYSHNTLGMALILKDLYTRKEVGMLEMLLREDYLFDLYGGVKMTPNTFAFILDDSGVVISHKNKGLLGKKIAVYTELMAKIRNSGRGNLSCRFAGKPYLLMYDTIDVNGWKLIYAIPQNELLKYTDSTKYTFITLVAVCLVILTVMSILMASWVTKPIEEVVSVISRYGKGELSARVHSGENRKDEIGILSKELNHMAERISGLIKKNYQIKIRMKEMELETLQAQINPHFLYNTLDTMNFLAKRHGVEEISRIAIALGDLMRISIRKDKNMIPVRDEINYVENYMIIQQMRFRDKVGLVLEVPEELYDFVIPKLTLQPLVENALVHGIEEKIGVGTIHVSGRLEGDDLFFTVTDDGVGFDEEAVCRMLHENLTEYGLIKGNGFLAQGMQDKKPSGGRIGLKNVDMRIKLCYGRRYGLTVHSSPGKGTSVIVRLPGKKKAAT